MLIAELFQFCIPVIHPGTLTAGSISYSNHDKWHSINHIYLPGKPSTSITRILPDTAQEGKKINIQESSRASNLSRPEKNEFVLWAYFKFPSAFRSQAMWSPQRLRGQGASVSHHLPLNQEVQPLLHVPPDLSGKEEFPNTALKHQHCRQRGLCDR